MYICIYIYIYTHIYIYIYIYIYRTVPPGTCLRSVTLTGADAKPLVVCGGGRQS